MAGIGFSLRRLYRQDTLTGLCGAYLHSAFASTGPWLFTVLAVAAITALGRALSPEEALEEFRVILIYNFSFSLVFAGPVFMVVTRFLADCIHRRDVSPAPGALVGALALLWGVELPPVAAFYFLYADLPVATAASAVVNLLLVSAVWLFSVFISTLKDYTRVTWAFLAGMLTAASSATLLAPAYGTAGMLCGWSVGTGVIIALLAADILTQYPYPVIRPFAFLGYFRKYWEVAVGGLVYHAAIWVDKWIMWFALEAQRSGSGLRHYPHYDSAMFIAYLTVVPSMALFLFHTETQFFEHYTRFYRDIRMKVPFARIQKNHQSIMRSIFGSAGGFFLLQGSIALLCMLTAPQIVQALKGDYLQIGMLRYGTLGALFQVLTLFLLVLLSYFDSRRDCLRVQVAFLISNVAFTLLSLYGGFPYYGYGYFLSCFLTFLLAVIVTAGHVRQLPYHTFITVNTSVR